MKDTDGKARKPGMDALFHTHEEIVDCLRRAGKTLGENFISPACLDLMAGRFTGYGPGVFLSCVFTPQRSFANPLGFVQGGMLMAAFDNVFGPFSILESGLAAVTLELNASFLRPLPVGDGPFEIGVRLVEKSRGFLVMEGEARTAGKALAARAYTRMFFVGEVR
ncbi:PaaI family thioesterase [Desulfobotulus sp.]|jgi:acyl-coenzyme A thioesterase PaaI-like protein|uniref:PaaI family thioesterase n=1 Tax=Desulfobotulus sp. TaxID=1940337 RepID=UPI002A362A92|nr:PaaI family thioesterase [Desulfobotulus sp.]MDY0162354.1 PaaI family thioesterase [Desulfobotulus sp.]